MTWNRAYRGTVPKVRHASGYAQVTQGTCMGCSLTADRPDGLTATMGPDSATTTHPPFSPLYNPPPNTPHPSPVTPQLRKHTHIHTLHTDIALRVCPALRIIHHLAHYARTGICDETLITKQRQKHIHKRKRTHTHIHTHKRNTHAPSTGIAEALQLGSKGMPLDSQPRTYTHALVGCKSDVRLYAHIYCKSRRSQATGTT